MTNDSIEQLIDSLNKGSTGDRVFTMPISDNVEYGRAWLNDITGDCFNFKEFYFIKNEIGSYVGAVYIMQNDLHAFIKPEHRGKGYLTESMNRIILPMLYQLGTKTQRISFSKREVGEYFKRRMGFQIIDENHAEKDLSCFSGIEEIVAKSKTMTLKDYLDIIKK